MRNALRSTDEVFHYWANRVQASGSSGSVRYDGDRLYSYAANIARLLPNGAVVFTTRSHSKTTASHVSKAKAAASHLVNLSCYNPADDARNNMAIARESIRDHLSSAERKGIRQTTRDNQKQLALHVADSANAYLAALPEDERGRETPIDTTDLEAVRAGLIAAEQAQESIRKEQQAARVARLADTLERWRTGDVITATSLYDAPPALRVRTHNLIGTEFPCPVVQTSHGAEIPVADAIKLWPLVQNVKRKGEDWTPPLLSWLVLGNYTLTQIKKDGSIVVGCHEIAYAELERIAKALGLAE